MASETSSWNWRRGLRGGGTLGGVGAPLAHGRGNSPTSVHLLLDFTKRPFFNSLQQKNNKYETMPVSNLNVHIHVKEKKEKEYRDSGQDSNPGLFGTYMYGYMLLHVYIMCIDRVEPWHSLYRYNLKYT